MSKKIIKIGIIGTGVGLRTYLPAFNALPDVEVLALAGSDQRRAVDFAQQHGIKHAMHFKSLCTFPEIDLVCVASPNPFHREQTATALEAGKHVLCEKPLAMSVDETRELINISMARPSQLALVNHQLRFNPYLKKVKQLIANGMIGRPYYLRVHQQSTAFADRNAPWNWSFDATQGGGVRLAMGSHLIDLALYWFGADVETVFGTMDPVVSKRHSDEGAEVQVRASGYFSATLDFAGGLSAHLSATAASCSTPRFEFSIFGDSGELHFNLADKLTGAFLNSPGNLELISVAAVSEAERENRISIFSGSFPYYASAIVKSLREHDWGFLDSAATFGDALHTQTILEALERAANSGAMQRLAGRQRSFNFV